MLRLVKHMSCEPCDDATLLMDSRRSSLFVPGILDTLICDEDHVQTGIA